MKKRLLALILAAVMCLSLFACSASDSDKDDEKETTETSENSDETTADKPDVTDDTTENNEGEEPAPEENVPGPILYKVSDDKGNVIWLFGSIHIGREDFYPLPDYVLDAFNGSDALAIECDVVAFENDLTAQTDMIMAMMYEDNSTIDDVISEELYEKAVAILEENDLYNEMFDYFMPCLWSDLIDSICYEKMELDLDSGIDKFFYNLAKEKDMDIIEVESVEFQYMMSINFSFELQEVLLEGAIETYENLDDAKKELDEMQDMWLKGDEKEFAEYLAEEEEFESEKEEALYHEYNNAMIVERNKAMTEYAVDALESGEEVFIVVGAAHVIGEGAMAENLRDLGYKVELVKR